MTEHPQPVDNSCRPGHRGKSGTPARLINVGMPVYDRVILKRPVRFEKRQNVFDKSLHMTIGRLLPTVYGTFFPQSMRNAKPSPRTTCGRVDETTNHEEYEKVKRHEVSTDKRKIVQIVRVFPNGDLSVRTFRDFRGSNRLHPARHLRTDRSCTPENPTPGDQSRPLVDGDAGGKRDYRRSPLMWIDKRARIC